MVLQSTFYDPVIGVDIHLEAVPAPPSPVPVPTPFPLPFLGMVFDPAGLIIGAAIGMATGGGPGVVLVNGMPATNVGTEVTNKLTMPHVFMPPGVAFIPPPMPAGDAELNFGSLNVSLAGSFGVRLGDMAMSCSDPVRLPTSVVMAIPKGMPVLNMPAMVPDLGSIAKAAAMKVGMKVLGALVKRGMGALFRAFRGSNFANKVSNALGGCEPPANAGRLREMWHRAVRFVTGHPVDVVTGNLFTEVVDGELPGPIPFVFERVYESARSHRHGVLGHGWSHSFDEAFWLERGRAIVRLGDGREVEFPLWHLPDRTLRAGDSVYLAIHKLTLRYHGGLRASVEHRDGSVHEFAPVAGGTAVSRLVKVRSRDNHHTIELTYDAAGRLEYLRDTGGRLVRFEHDDHGRLTALKMPVAHERGWYVHRRYLYDHRGDLVEVRDSKGAAYRYQYQGHLLVQETDRAGLSFYFQYDGTGSIAKCVRTWGDGGIYDHVVHYDVFNKRTTVENSLGAVTVYEYNARNQVVAVRDPLGAATRFDYDADTGGTTLEVSPVGGETRSRYDARGNLIEVTNAVGATSRFEYDDLDQPVRAIDPRGGEWRWRYDEAGRLLERRFPTGEGFALHWERGLLRTLADAQGRTTRLTYDERSNVRTVVLPNGGVTEQTWDELGRVVSTRNARDGVSRFRYDSEGRLVESTSAVGTLQRQVFDAEGNLLQAEDATRDVRLGYGHYHRVVWREEDGTRLTFEYDTEDQLTTVVNEAGERYTFEFDPAGRAVAETGFDGRTRRYVLDKAGLPALTLLPSGRTTKSQYDLLGRLVEAKHSDGAFARFAYGVEGLIARAENESTVVELERDAVGRVVREVMNGVEVRSAFDASGDRTEVTTSLGARVVMLRDALGLPQDIFLGRPDANRAPDIHIERDGLGLETARRFSNGIEVEWSRDAAGRPTERRTLRRNETRGTTGGAAAPPSLAGPPLLREVVDARSYTWRGEDQIAAIAERGRGAIHYDHDRRGRLIRERRPDRVVERAMDVVGNIYRTPDGRDRRYGAGGRLELADGVRYEHDEDGNQTLKSGPDGDWRYRWNGHGMLREVERPDGVRVQFEYDCFARRTVKRVVAEGAAEAREVGFVWDGNDVIHEVRAEGATTWVFEPDAFAPMAKIEGGQRYGVVSDHLGTPTELRDEAGEIAWRAQLDVYGVAESDVMREGCPWRWPGQYEDEETDLYFNRFRYFSSSTGAYLTIDPIGLFGGVVQRAYPSDPSTEFDPLGLDKILGDLGEDAVATFLAKRGYQVVGSMQNASGHGIDLVLRNMHSGTLSVAEVKVNSSRLSSAQRNGAAWFVESRIGRALQGEGAWRGISSRTREIAQSLRRHLDVHGEIDGQVIRVTVDADGNTKVKSMSSWCKS